MSFPVVWFAESQKMNNYKVGAVSKRSQAYILIKQRYSVRNTAQLIGKLSFFCPEVVKTR